MIYTTDGRIWQGKMMAWLTDVDDVHIPGRWGEWHERAYPQGTEQYYYYLNDKFPILQRKCFNMIIKTISRWIRCFKFNIKNGSTIKRAIEISNYIVKQYW
jgi:hypothetical protein